MNKKLPPFSDNRKSKTCTELSRSIQNRKLVGIVALVVTFAMCGVVAQAQQAGKVPRIGILELGSPSASASQIKAFQQGLHDLGYIEGKNITSVPSPFLATHRALIFDFAAKNRLPAMYSTSDFVEAGGLMSYGPDLLDNWRRAATFVDKILKGAKPADLPVEQPTKFEFIINLKAAKQIGVTISSNVLARADKVIK